MARTYTTAELLTKLRTRGGYENSGRLTDAKLLEFLEGGLAELHDLLVAKFGEDYMTTRTTGAFVAGTDAYSLPTNFLKVLRVDVQEGGVWRRLRRFQLVEMGDGTTGTPEAYRIEGDQIYFDPPPSAVATYRLIYVKCAPKLSTSGSPPSGSVNTVEGYNGWELLAVYYALLEAKESQDEPTGGVQQRIARAVARIEWAADGRDAGEPMTIQDLESLDQIQESM